LLDTTNKAIEFTANALDSNPDAHWIVGFSGGKDSTALLKIFYAAVLQAKSFHGIIDVIYCDTGVENPVLDDYVKNTLYSFDREVKVKGMPFRVILLKAPIGERFFVKLIGRGYPPPTNSFRWCTKSLRIRPVSKFITNAAQGHAIVAIGLRRTESVQRSRSIEHAGGDYWQFQNECGRQYQLFLPILDFDVQTVWSSIFGLTEPDSIISDELMLLYHGASGECPMVRSPQSPPCASGRFGCWTCTVVRKDHSAIKLIEAGHTDLLSFLNFRNWLSEIRNDPKRRWPHRRNGNNGLGPFTLSTRREILDELHTLEDKTCTSQVSTDEMDAITNLWSQDVLAENNFL